MSSRDRIKAKGRRDSGRFLALPYAILRSEAYRSLSPRAVKLLVDVAAQYMGFNNGDLTATFKLMNEVGWSSNDQLRKALDELLCKGFLVLTRQGMRPRVPSLYAVTWQAIDECGGKLERPPTKVPLGYWKLGTNPEHTPKKIKSEGRHAAHTRPPYGLIETQRIQ